MIRCFLGLALAAFHVASFAWTATGIRGINVNDALESRFWRARPSDADLKEIRAAGFNAVRLPIRVTNHVGAADRIDPDYLKRVRSVVLAAQALQFKVVVDLHENVFSDQGPASAHRLLHVWKQVLQVLPTDSDAVAFELLNEPHGALTAAVWNAVQRKLIDSLRSAGFSQVKFVASASPWSHADALRSLDVQSDVLITATAHYYVPFAFTHQSAPWVKNSDRWRGRSFAPSEEDLREMRREFQPVLDWVRGGRTAFVGEFGAYRSGVDPQAYRRWVQESLNLFQQANLGWFYWSYIGDFGIFDAEKQCWDPVLAILTTEEGRSARICD